MVVTSGWGGDVKGHKLSIVRWISFGDLMYSIGDIVNAV